MCGARSRAEGVLREQDCTPSSFYLIFGSFHRHPFHLRATSLKRTNVSSRIKENEWLQRYAGVWFAFAPIYPCVASKVCRNTPNLHFSICTQRPRVADDDSRDDAQPPSVTFIFLPFERVSSDSDSSRPLHSNTLCGLRGRFDLVTRK